MIIPCKDCICFALCNSKFYRKNKFDTEPFVIPPRLLDCSLIYKYLEIYSFVDEALYRVRNFFKHHDTM